MQSLEVVAQRQHGLFVYDQAMGSGLTPGQLAHWARHGRVEHIGRLLYRFPGAPRTWRQALLAAVLIAGPGAVASHRAAAVLWRLPGFPAGPLDVTRPRQRRSSAGAGVHHTLYLPPHHRSVVDAIPVTSPPRMLLDICGCLRAQRAERAVDNALNADLLKLGELEICLAETARRGRPGSGVLRAILDTRCEGYVPPASELEALLLAVLASAGLPPPDRQVSVGGTSAPVGRVDFLYRRHRLVIEADSRRHHGGWLATEADRRRDAQLVAAGYQVLRVTWWQLIHEPELVVRAVRAVLARAA